MPYSISPAQLDLTTNLIWIQWADTDLVPKLTHAMIYRQRSAGPDRQQAFSVLTHISTYLNNTESYFSLELPTAQN